MTVSRGRTALFASLVACASLASAVQPSSAQGLSFDWGGSETAGGSGKQTVAFRGGTPGEVIVSFGDRRLYYVTRPGEALSYPIAIPREQSRWAGVTSVSQKRENPGWTPTPTMRAENPRLPMWVPGGHPLNPLGVRALYLGSSAYRIHGTDAPWTIGSAASKGCVRMFNQDVLDLYPRVKVGARVTVTWNRYSSNAVAAAPAASGNYAASNETAGERSKRYYRPVTKTYRRTARPAQSTNAGEE